MAKTIPQLTDATTVNAADELIIQQGGITKRATGAELAKGLNTINGTVNVKDFGAAGDGVADDTAAISSALSFVAQGGCLYFPQGVYAFSSGLLLSASKVSIMGSGSGSTTLRYIGQNAGVDLITVGAGALEISNVHISGLTIASSLQMTAGFALKCNKLVRSSLFDIIINGQDLGAINCFGGVWMNGIDDVYISHLRTGVQSEGIRVNGTVGAGPKAGLSLAQSKIGGGTIGVRVAGAFGGLYVTNTDIIGMSTAGVLVDTSHASEANRELFLGLCSIDSVNNLSGGGHGIHVNDALAGDQTLTLSGSWVASSGSHGVYVENANGYKIIITGARIFNNVGDGIRNGDISSVLSVTGCNIAANGGFGINGVVNSNGIRASSNVFLSNTSGSLNTTVSQGRFAISDGQILERELLIGNQANVAPSSRQLTIVDNSNTEKFAIGAMSSGFTQTVLQANVPNKASGTDYNFISCGNSSGGAFTVRGDGTVFADVGTISSPADYAEMFEWEDGNESNEQRFGKTVSLAGNKIKIAEEGEVVIGVVSAAPIIIGDAAPFLWSQALLKNKYGAPLIQVIECLEWDEVDHGEFSIGIKPDGKQAIVVERQGGITSHCYPASSVPEGIIVPENAKTTHQRVYIENPSWDKTREYVPRLGRKEWAAVGLVGKLKIQSDQVTNPAWIKMRDLDSNTEEWLVR